MVVSTPQEAFLLILLQSSVSSGVTSKKLTYPVATVFLRVMKTVWNELVMAAAQLRTSRDNLLTV